MQDSNFKFYSLGIVAVDKPTTFFEITVMPLEHIVDQQGDINDTSDYKSNTTNHKNTPYKVETKVSNVLKAKWIPLSSSNRLSAPDVIKGETVMIYTYADTNEYYWTTVFNEPEIRRLEKVLYGFSNLSSGARAEAFDRTTSYWAEVDTLNKYIKIHTSDNDGEFTTYDIFINTKEGSITIEDGVGNFLKHDSKQDTLTAQYNKEINILAPTVNIKSDVLNIENKELNIESVKITETSVTRYSEANGASITSEGGNIEIQANQVKHETPLVVNTGNMQTAGMSIANPHQNS